LEEDLEVIFVEDRIKRQGGPHARTRPNDAAELKESG
jgi:hypothetical protein